MGEVRADTCLYNGIDEAECEAGGPDDICQLSSLGDVIICDLTRNRDWYGGDAHAYTYSGYWEIAGDAGGGFDYCCRFALDSDIVELQVHGTSHDDVIKLRCPSVDGGCGADRELTPSGTLIGYVNGADGDDQITGSDYDSPTTYWDRLHGGDDIDAIWGLGGEDYIQGDGGSDILRGGEDADLIYGNNGDDQINGGPGNDTLYGNSGEDTLCGDTEPSSTLIDVLDGGTEDDELWGPEATCTSVSTRNGGNGGPGTDLCDNCSYPSYTNTEGGLISQPAACPTP